MSPAVIAAVRGDITLENTDAIVNAANATLMGGGGVDGAIHAAAGPALLDACRRARNALPGSFLPVGSAVVTEAGRLPCRYVVHTVGPNWHRGQQDPAQLASCFTTSLAEAARVGARSIAFPAVSAGVYGWGAQAVARIAVDAVVGATREGVAADSTGAQRDVTGIELVRFVLFNDGLLQAFEEALVARDA